MAGLSGVYMVESLLIGLYVSAKVTLAWNEAMRKEYEQLRNEHNTKWLNIGKAEYDA